MANRIRVAAEPCIDGKHKFSNSYASGHCDSPHCEQWSEYHCIRCGWYVRWCRCGNNNGKSKISYRQREAIDKWMEQKRKERGQ